MTTLYFVKKSPTARAPRRGTAHAAGFDLFADATSPILIKGGAGFVAVDTGIAVRIPEGYYGRIAPRSGLALRQHIDVGAGVIDDDYSDSIKVLLCCVRGGDTEYVAIDPSKAIAQLIIEACSYCPAVEVEELPASGTGGVERPHTGFGSTDAADEPSAGFAALDIDGTPFADSDAGIVTKAVLPPSVAQLQNLRIPGGIFDDLLE